MRKAFSRPARSHELAGGIVAGEPTAVNDTERFKRWLVCSTMTLW